MPSSDWNNLNPFYKLVPNFAVGYYKELSPAQNIELNKVSLALHSRAATALYSCLLNLLINPEHLGHNFWRPTSCRSELLPEFQVVFLVETKTTCFIFNLSVNSLVWTRYGAGECIPHINTENVFHYYRRWIILLNFRSNVRLKIGPILWTRIKILKTKSYIFYSYLIFLCYYLFI